MTTKAFYCIIKVMEIKNFQDIDYKDNLNKNNVISFVPRGNSMWPTLKNKGQSVVVQAKRQRLNKLDVALYVRGQNNFVLHRVMQVLEDGYLMCGDSQFSLEKVTEDQVFGVMIGFYRGEKYVDCNDDKYKKKVEKWYKRKRLRKFRINFFFFRKKVINKLKRIFGGKNKNV